MSEDDQALYKKGLNTPEAENQNPDYTMTKRISPPPPPPPPTCLLMARPVFSRGLSNIVPLWQRIVICSPVVFIPTM